MNDGGSSCSGPVPLIEELAVLRQRKNELEQQLTALQDSRKHLMSQLESLMKMIKVFFLFCVRFDLFDAIIFIY